MAIIEKETDPKKIAEEQNRVAGLYALHAMAWVERNPAANMSIILGKGAAVSPDNTKFNPNDRDGMTLGAYLCSGTKAVAKTPDGMLNSSTRQAMNLEKEPLAIQRKACTLIVQEFEKRGYTLSSDNPNAIRYVRPEETTTKEPSRPGAKVTEAARLIQ